jgi:hypothetical protein
VDITHLRDGEKKDLKRAVETCATTSEGIPFMSLEFQE